MRHTIAEAATTLGCTPSAVKDRIRRGTLAAGRDARGIYITAAELRRAMQQGPRRAGRPRK